MKLKLLLCTVIGGFLLTLASVIYQVKPLVIDAEMVNFGFPFTWFIACRKALHALGTWHYHINCLGLIGDITTYSVVLYLIIMGFRKRGGLAEH